MKISTLWYSIRQGIKNIRRNLMFSLASIGTMVACLFLFGIFYMIVVNFQAAVQTVEKNVTVSVFFNEGISQEQIDAIGEAIRYREELNTIEFVSADAAWNTFREESYDAVDSDLITNAFNGDNPLKNSASYQITLKDVSMQGEFVKFVEGLEGVRSVKSSEAVANGLASVNSLVGYASMAIILILLFVAIFLITNTITIGITVRKEEIGIMKLIGATDFFVRAPFMVEGVIIGLVGSAIPVMILRYMYHNIIDYLITRFPIINTLVNFVPTDTVFGTLTPLCLIVGVGIGLVGSSITTRRHLHV